MTLRRVALTVEARLRAGRDETPVGIEVVDGPYLVLRRPGRSRGWASRARRSEVGGPVDGPSATADGTLWLRRPDTGSVCVLRPGRAALDCATRTAAGRPGAHGRPCRPAWLDTTAGTLSTGTAPRSPWRRPDRPADR